MIDDILALIDSVGEHFAHQNIVVAVNGKSRKTVRLPVDQTAGTYIFPHHGIAVIQRIGYPADKECIPERLVRIAVQNPDTDLGLFTPETGSQIDPLLGEHIGKTPVFKGSFTLQDLIFIDPGMAAPDGTFLFFGNRH